MKLVLMPRSFTGNDIAVTLTTITIAKSSDGGFGDVPMRYDILELNELPAVSADGGSVTRLWLPTTSSFAQTLASPSRNLVETR
jgi:hypothetical protein